MATNIVSTNDRIPITLSANVNSGDLLVKGNVFGVALTSGSSGDTVAIATGVRCTLPKANAVSTSMAVGDLAYFQVAGNIVTNSATSNTKIGIVTKAAANTDTTIEVVLNEAW